MDICFDILAWVLSFTGHLGLWCVGYNRVHATAWPRRRRKVSEKVVLLAIALPAVWVLSVWFMRQTISFGAIYDVSRIAHTYGVICLWMGVYFVFRFCFRKFTESIPSAVVDSATTLVDLKSQLGIPLIHGETAKWLDKIPGNQSACLAIESMTLQLPRCPVELDGFRICQISDLHFMGHLGKEYFAEVVRKANEFQPDLILITGDIVDTRECVSWINDILGALYSKFGVFYVLGNHDLRIKDEKLIRDTLAENNIIAVGGKWHCVTVGEAEVILAGNEIPWFGGAETLATLPNVGNSNAPHIKVLLSHSPDQVDWATKYDFDLMLCGHTHGGQIRFPVIGPVVAPSKYGVKFCSGTFEVGNMLMHVSRGLSGDDLIRINCPPELGLFTLQSGGERQ